MNSKVHSTTNKNLLQGGTKNLIEGKILSLFQKIRQRKITWEDGSHVYLLENLKCC